MIETEVSPSVRFANKVIIETSSITNISKSSLEFTVPLKESRKNSINSHHFIDTAKLDAEKQLGIY
jgi:hypothetical protein